MWWETQARLPFARQKVLLSSAPQARIVRSAWCGQRDALGHVPARAPEHQPARPSGRARAPARPSHRSVSRSAGRAPAAGPRSRRAAASASLVAICDRLVRDVAAGHHERLRPALRGDVGEQQVVQRRVGKHQPELERARGDRLCDGGARKTRREHDRAPSRADQLTLRSRSGARAPPPARPGRPSARTACPRDACASEAARSRPRRPLGRRGGSRPRP